MEPAQDEPLERLYDLDLNLVLVSSLSERWRLALVMSPGIASDFRNIDPGHVTFQVAVVLTRTVRPALAWDAGVSVTNAFGEVLPVPVLALEWRGHQARADILAPARGAFLWTPGDIIELGISAEVDGNLYTLGQDGELNDAVVRHSVINVGPLVTVKISPQIHLSVAGGTSLRRRLEIEGRDGRQIQNATLERGAHLQAGLSIFPPPTAPGR